MTDITMTAEAYAANIATAKAEALRAAAQEIVPPGLPEDVTTIYDPYDVQEWLLKRAAEHLAAPKDNTHD